MALKNLSRHHSLPDALEKAHTLEIMKL